jgi:hypothetical protein
MQRARGLLHDFPVICTAHQDGNQWFVHAPPSLKFYLNLFMVFGILFLIACQISLIYWSVRIIFCKPKVENFAACQQRMDRLNKID